MGWKCPVLVVVARLSRAKRTPRTIGYGTRRRRLALREAAVFFTRTRPVKLALEICRKGGQGFWASLDTTARLSSKQCGGARPWYASTFSTTYTGPKQVRGPECKTSRGRTSPGSRSRQQGPQAATPRPARRRWRTRILPEKGRLPIVAKFSIQLGRYGSPTYGPMGSVRPFEVPSSQLWEVPRHHSRWPTPSARSPSNKCASLSPLGSRNGITRDHERVLLAAPPTLGRSVYREEQNVRPGESMPCPFALSRIPRPGLGSSFYRNGIAP